MISSAEVPGILERAAAGGGGNGNGGVGLDALLSLAEALDVRETGSATHCRRVGRLAELTARELGLRPTPSSGCGSRGSSTTWAGWRCRTR